MLLRPLPFCSCLVVGCRCSLCGLWMGVVMRWVWLLFVGLTLCLSSGAAFAQENASFSSSDDDVQSVHEGYYYPKPQTVEHFVSAVVTLPESDQTRRQAFIIGMTMELLDG